jgi:hypothetical protein
MCRRDAWLEAEDNREKLGIIPVFGILNQYCVAGPSGTTLFAHNISSLLNLVNKGKDDCSDCTHRRFLMLGAAINFMASYTHHSVTEAITALKDPYLVDVNPELNRLAERI